MLEFLVFAFFSDNAEDFFGDPIFYQPSPQIEILEPAQLPQKKEAKKEPKLLANDKSAILAMDLDSGKVLLDKNADRPQNIASLTKIMTALIILEENEMDEVVTVPEEATRAIGAQIGLYQHERLTIRTLLEAILIPSANDAAVALAIHNATTEANFVQKMNQKAQDLGLQSAHFYNATGLDMRSSVEASETDPQSQETVHANRMSARDVLRLTRTALKNDFFRATVQKDHFYGTSVDEEFFHEKPTTNQLLDSFLNLKGVKTGYERSAGECFIALGENDGHEILTVILGSEDRFGETKNFLSWIYEAYEWQ